MEYIKPFFFFFLIAWSFWKVLSYALKCQENFFGFFWQQKKRQDTRQICTSLLPATFQLLFVVSLCQSVCSQVTEIKISDWFWSNSLSTSKLYFVGTFYFDSNWFVLIVTLPNWPKLTFTYIVLAFTMASYDTFRRETFTTRQLLCVRFINSSSY
jgi:hypothetical protein